MTVAAPEGTVAERASAKGGFLDTHETLRGRGPAWLRALREEGLSRFDALGFPGPKDEEWRQTSVAPVARTTFSPAPASEDGGKGAERPLASSLGGPRLVLVNGRPSAALSSLESLPKGVSLGSLAQAIGKDESVESTLGRIAPWRERPFAALNTALLDDGAFVSIAPGAVVDTPIEIVWVTVPSKDAPVAVHPRTLVLAGKGAEVRIVESFVAETPGVYLSTPVAEIGVAENARVEHVRLQDDAEEAFHLASIDAELARDARYVSVSVALGAALSRCDLGGRLAGSGAEATLQGLTLLGGTRHADHHTSLDHAVAHCPSHELYKSILWDRARYVFNGRIVVREDAQKTDAKQSNRNLILSNDAIVFTRPQLEIYADDVRCTHGATIGRLDDAALFYLRARGLSADAARDLLIRAFAGEVLASVTHGGWRERIEEEALSRLPASGRG